jgi:hypothetical protein
MAPLADANLGETTHGKSLRKASGDAVSSC